MNVCEQCYYYLKSLDYAGCSLSDDHKSLSVAYNQSSNLGSFTVHAEFREDCDDVRFWCYDIVNINQEHYDAALSKCNDFNLKKAYIRFFIDSDRDINVDWHYDIPTDSDEPVGKWFLDKIEFFSDIIDGIYKELIEINDSTGASDYGSLLNGLNNLMN